MNGVTSEQPARHPPLIGLTGPIGCGKSTVGQMLHDLGGTVIDADELAREVTGTAQPALARIRERFGEAVFQPNGALDRQAMADVAFNDPAALADLEAIIHPAVRELIEQQLQVAEHDGVPFVAIEAIKLIEGGLADRCDIVWLVDCAPSMQRSRLLRRGHSKRDATQRIDSQGDELISRLEAQMEGRQLYRRLSTDGSLAATRERVEDALADVLATSG